MNTSNIRPIGEPEAVTQIAADWALRQERQEMNEAEWAEFDQWIKEDPAHGEAFEDVLWALGAAQRHASDEDIGKIRTAALQARKSSHGKMFGWGGVAGALAASLALFLLWTGSPDELSPGSTGPSIAQQDVAPKSASYSTAIGEKSEIILPDGSTATLDTDSELRVAYNDTERAVYLLRGQALFDVEQDKNIPFQVYANEQRITAIGTIFNVRLEGEAIKVSLVEGVVRVSDQSIEDGETASGLQKDLVMRAGEVLEITPQQSQIFVNANVGSVASWKGGTLVFDDTRLSDAVAEINRYTTKPIAIADSNVGAHRITGVFKTNDPEYFSRAMTEIFPIEMSRSADGSPVLRSAR